MKNIIILILLFSINSYGQIENDLKLTLSKTDKFGKEYFILEVQNNNESKVDLLKTAYESFWCHSIPCVNFIAETKKDNKWILLHEFKTTLRDAPYDWKKPINRVVIEPSSKKTLGEFYFNKGIDNWFGLIGDQTIRISVEYNTSKNKTELSELKKLNYKPLKLTSNKIQIEYIDKNSEQSNSLIYQKIFKHSVLKYNITPAYLIENSTIINRPKNSKDALEKGLSKDFSNIKKWKILTTFYDDASIEGTYSRIIIFSTGVKKFAGISTQVSRFDNKDLSGKYSFNYFELKYP
jgi:hypothetical protein